MSDVIIIRRADIPVICEVQTSTKKHAVGALRDFRRHPAHRAFIPEQARLAINWAFLAPGQILEPHLHPIRSMIVVCRGSAELLGVTTGVLEEGDIVAVGAERVHGLVGGTPHGLHALSIQFEERGLYEDVSRALVAFPAKRS